MRLGLVSDIHASYGSLVRAFDLLAERGVDRVACMGDIVQHGADGDAVIRLLREHWVICVQGNHDANAVRRAREEGDRDGLSADSIEWLAQLPAERSYEWEGVRVAIAHAAPYGVDAYVWPDDIPKRLKRALRAAEHDVILLGHTHVPMKVAYHDTWLVNPGSVRGTRARDSHSCGVLDLPAIELEVIALQA
ncbi:MAG TPA: YfcE family phosphodiesterase [Kofleriaceae bacterium]|nr:YfcE family phosphodiesterase [Kofleriaceae bacterium]